MMMMHLISDYVYIIYGGPNCCLDFILSKMKKSIADQYFLWALMFCYDAQTLTFLNKSSSNSPLEIKKRPTGFKRGQKN